MKTTLIYLSGAIVLLVSLVGFTMLVSPSNVSASSSNLPPTLVAVSPTEAYNLREITITITGTGFFVTGGTTNIVPQVTLGRELLPHVTFVSDTSLIATVPAGLPHGVYTITVTNPDGQSANLTNAFRVHSGGNGKLDPWQMMTSQLNVARSGHASVVAGDYIYVIGGVHDQYLRSVEYARINPDGTLGPWQITSSMNTARYLLAAVATPEYIYVLGGRGLSSVERAQINSDGSLQPWQELGTMSMERVAFSAVVSNGVIYAIGGVNWDGGYGIGSVEYSKINNDGSLGVWHSTSQMNTPRGWHFAASLGGYVYAVGGQRDLTLPGSSLDSVERAPVNDDGTLGNWQYVSSMQITRCNLGGITAYGYIYAVGGGDCHSTLHNSVEKARVNSDGTLEAWEMVTPINVARHVHSVAFKGTHLYTIGGNNGSDLNSVESARINSPQLLSFAPSAVASDQVTAVAASGENFLPPISLQLGDSIALDTTFGSPITLMTVIPSGLANGWYTATLTNGDGRVATLAHAIRVDGPGPVVVGDYGLTINDGALFTNEITVTLTIGSRSDTALVQVSNDGGFAGAQWAIYTSHKTWQITQYGNYVIPRVVYVRYKDINGNMSATFQDDIILDVTAPTGSVEIVPGIAQRGLGAVGMETTAQSVAISATNDCSYTVHLPLVLKDFFCPPTGPANVTLHLSAQDDVSGVADMLISNLATFNCATWEPYATTKAWYVPQGTITTVYVRFRDNAGNVSDVVTDTITMPLQ